MISIQEMYAYSSSVRRRFANKLSELPWEVVEKNREASFYSMKNILLHIIDNEDWIVNWVIHDRSREYRREKRSEEYRSMKEVFAHLDEVEAKTRRYLDSVAGDSNRTELSRHVRFILQSGAEFDLSVEESLFQSFTEQLYHMGELIALLWQENIEPPKMQWFWNNPRHALQGNAEAVNPSTSAGNT